MTLIFALFWGLFAVKAASNTGISPEQACGPAYHQFGQEPIQFHSIETLSLKDALSSDVVVEGIVVSKRTYPGAPVENDVKLRISKVLQCCQKILPSRSPAYSKQLVPGNVITINVSGGYAPDGDHTCLRDTVHQGARIETGRPYLVSLTKEQETESYRSDPQGSWFRIAKDGDVIPLTPSL